MKLKQRIGDFRVRELLAKGFIQERGDHAVYRVTKRKLTTQEAAAILAEEARVEPAEVAIAGLKDRQGITIQHMSVAGGRPVKVRSKELLIEQVGRSLEEVSSAVSLGNAFEILARDLDRGEVQAMRKNVPLVREHGVINYFDEQRFGNLKHGQGWIARDLMKGKAEAALRTFLTARSSHDNDRRRRFKEQVNALWGDWRGCRDEAGRYGQHHSVFEHLSKNPEGFAGAFQRVATRLRLIHLYAYQSHVWNRAVCELLRTVVPAERRLTLESLEGSLITFDGAAPAAIVEREVFRLPGDGLEDVEDQASLSLLEDELARQRMVPDEFRIQGIAGFQLKGEDRPLRVIPRHLRVRPAEEDPINPRARMIKVRFELPRGCYATLVVKRLLAGVTDRSESGRADYRGSQRDPRRDSKRGSHGNSGRDSRHGNQRASRSGGASGDQRRSSGEDAGRSGGGRGGSREDRRGGGTRRRDR